MPPVGKCGGSLLLEGLATVEVAFLVEVVVDRAVHRGELMQTSHPPEPQHRPLPSSLWRMTVLHPIVGAPASRLVACFEIELPHRRSVRPKLVGDDRIGTAAPLQQLP